MAKLEDHKLRYTLANELHARPFPSLDAPCFAACLAIKQPDNAVARDRQADVDHLLALLDRFGAAHPKPGANHFFGDLGKYRLKWEQHTEFVTYTIFGEGTHDKAFDPTMFDVFPDDWLAQAPGARITSILIRVEQMSGEAEMRQKIQNWFVHESVAATHVLDSEAVVAADFRIDESGHSRVAIFVDKGCSPRRTGRVVQRMTEIETYKQMSMLGLARAREVQGRLSEIGNKLSALVTGMGELDGASESRLTDLLNISAELEKLNAETSFRFGATAAYEAIVSQRIEVLREQRWNGHQTLREFMTRRYDPAMRTVTSVERQLHEMSERAMRAADLFRTKVDVERSAQNQALLESMDRRADVQLRLQRTVEGLSVVAISYYAVSLGAYLLEPVGTWLNLEKGQLLSIITLPVVLAVWLMVRSIRKRFH